MNNVKSKSFNKDKKNKESEEKLNKRGISKKERNLSNLRKKKYISRDKSEKKIKEENTVISKEKYPNNQKRVRSTNKKDKKLSSKDKPKNEKNKIKNEEEDEKDEINLEDIFSQNNNLYSLLGLQKTATNLEIRKAYKHLVLLCHPDKNKTDPETSAKFINITRAYKILSNEKTRKYYDETGEYDEENEGVIDIDDTLNFFRKIYSPQDIETYESKYKGSEEEEQDLITFYKENQGNITKILECIPCSNNEDIKRFIKIYEKLFKKKILKKNKKYEETKNKIKLLKEDKNETKEAEETLDKLTKQIMVNKKRRNYNDYLAGLARKYGGKDDENEEQEENYEISEEEFKKISDRLKKGNRGKNKKK